jgi:Protein of unknown function (DUF2934)
MNFKNEKHAKAITVVQTEKVTGVIRSISDGRPAEIDNKIHQRAHELYVARGRASGRELEDWLRAEIELLDA